jgi:hypothetical protein
MTHRASQFNMPHTFPPHLSPGYLNATLITDKLKFAIGTYLRVLWDLSIAMGAF